MIHHEKVTPITDAPSYRPSFRRQVANRFESLSPTRQRLVRVVAGAVFTGLALKGLDVAASNMQGGNTDPATYDENRMRNVAGLTLAAKPNESPTATVRFDPVVDDGEFGNRVTGLDVTDPLRIPTSLVYRAGVDTANSTGIWYGVTEEDLKNALPESQRQEVVSSLEENPDKDGILWVNEQRATPDFER